MSQSVSQVNHSLGPYAYRKKQVLSFCLKAFPSAGNMQMILLLRIPQKHRSCPITTSPQTMNDICVQANSDYMILNINECALLQTGFGGNPPLLRIIIADDQKVSTDTTMTLLGVNLHQSFKWDTHIEGIITKASSKKYFLVTLKRSETTCKQLLKFYTTFLPPDLEYATPVWHPGITQKLSGNTEQV